MTSILPIASSPLSSPGRSQWQYLSVAVADDVFVACPALVTSALTCVYTSAFCLGQVYISMDGSLKVGCLAQAMMVSPKGDVAASPDVGGMDDELEGEVDMEVEVNHIFCRIPNLVVGCVVVVGVGGGGGGGVGVGVGVGVVIGVGVGGREGGGVGIGVGVGVVSCCCGC